MTKLIFRIATDETLTAPFELRFPLSLYLEIAADRAGEMVFFGHSDVPGIWTVVAMGRFAGWSNDVQTANFSFDEIDVLSEPVVVVTDGDAESDRLRKPYALDTLLEEDLALVFARNRNFEQSAFSPQSVAAEDQAPYVKDRRVHRRGGDV